MMRIVVDALGSDHRPVADVSGAVQAAREYDCAIILVGDEQRVRQELGKHSTNGLKIDIVHAADEILMVDKPAEVVRGKKQSSMHVGAKLVKDGQADAFVSAGNTGALLAISKVTLHDIAGLDRPALSQIIGIGETRVILLDIGANVDNKAENLVQFAIMGEIFARQAMGLAKPRVALLSNGEEEVKGNAVVKEASSKLRETQLNYIGFVEGNTLFRDRADVVVMDGFIGNLVLKTLEGTTRFLIETIGQEIRSSPITTLGGVLARPAFRRIRKQIDPNEIGGAPLLGLNGVVIKAHGSSTDQGVKNAIRQARAAVSGKIVEAIREELARNTAAG